MKTAVRYYSRSGTTKKVADAIAEAAGTAAKSTDEVISEPVEILFLGGALYAGSIDRHLKEFVQKLTSDMVKKVAVFSLSAAGKSIKPQIEELLKGTGISVIETDFSCKGKFILANKGRPNEQDLAEAAAFARKLIG